jgi:Cu-Zn family superoxide dismutase
MKVASFSIAIMSSLIALTSCGGDREPETGDMMRDTTTTQPVEEMGRTATAVLMAKSGSMLDGTAAFVEDNNGNVTLTVNVRHVSPGKHAIHIHQNGDCSSPDGESAGGHWNPTNEPHGKWDETDHHQGDIGNLDVSSDSTAVLTMTTDKWCIGCSDSTKNIVGKSVIIHASYDDFKTQPTGNAGGRIGCGVIEMR